MSSAESGPDDTNSENYTDMSSENSDVVSMSNQSKTSLAAVAGQSRTPGKKVTKSMEEILKELVKLNKLREEHEMILAEAAGNVDFDYANKKEIEYFDAPTDHLKLFASFLHYYAPQAYEYVRNKYNTPLPDIQVLGSWLENDKFKAGFTKQAFDMLKKRSTEKGQRLICSLVHDHYQLFTHESWVELDVGAGPLQGDYVDEIDGRTVYIILLVSLEENLRIPLCYFLGDQEGDQTEANLIKMCLQRTHEVGVDVVSITNTNRTAKIARTLGCKFEDYKKLKTTFNHPVSGKPVAVYMDPSVSLRSCFITLTSTKELYNGQKQKICQKFIDQLKNILENQTFQFDFSTSRLDLRNMLAKIDLISETLMPSLGAALEICKNKLKLPNFAQAGPTIEFLTMINTLYYILYSKVDQTGYARPIRQENAKEIIEFLEEAKKYISMISYTKSGRQLAVEDSTLKAAGFKELLTDIETLKHLHKTLTAEGALHVLPTYQLSSDHLDEFLEVIVKHDPRQRAGKFTPIYRRFFSDLKVIITGHDLIESCGITNSKKPLNTIKTTSGKRAYDRMFSIVGEKRRKTEDDKKADKNVAKFVKHLDIEQDRADRQYMVAYVAGWIAVQLAKTLRCEECIDALLINKKLWFHKYITMKELKGVCLPSVELFRICWECERSVKGQKQLDNAAQRRLLSRVLHIAEPTHRHHYIHLTKAVVAKYVRLRLGIDNAQQKAKKSKPMFWF